jgi:hypothetical protein
MFPRYGNEIENNVPVPEVMAIAIEAAGWPTAVFHQPVFVGRLL